jgi:hypothetical protein
MTGHDQIGSDGPDRLESVVTSSACGLDVFARFDEAERRWGAGEAPDVDARRRPGSEQPLRSEQQVIARRSADW